MGLRTRLAAGVVAVAAAIPLALTSATPASSAPAQWSSISIVASADYPGYYNVYVWGHFNTTAYQSTVGMRLKGDDPVFNDDLGVSATTTAYYGDFSFYKLVWKGTLNEDWEGRDEIFAQGSSSTGWSFSGPNFYGYF